MWDIRLPAGGEALAYRNDHPSAGHVVPSKPSLKGAENRAPKVRSVISIISIFFIVFFSMFIGNSRRNVGLSFWNPCVKRDSGCF